MMLWLILIGILLIIYLIERLAGHIDNLALSINLLTIECVKIVSAVLSEDQTELDKKT